MFAHNVRVSIRHHWSLETGVAGLSFVSKEVPLSLDEVSFLFKNLGGFDEIEILAGFVTSVFLIKSNVDVPNNISQSRQRVLDQFVPVVLAQMSNNWNDDRENEDLEVSSS